ncbi:MAG: ATP-binding cassette domain-containing protein [Spirochaetaceae bacterium]|nr:ATP-binding cassette domain-containing protein [Spirochaetaceae bacterium]GMO29737.1 MAG: ATP-binding cassette domain-containing protein [Termitinemataceae bacterium]
MLEAKNIGFAYRKNKPIFSGVNISINAGDRLAITGPSGCGKSTFARILAGFLRPSSGSVLFEGRALPEEGYNPVQLIFQHPEKAVNPRWHMARTLNEAWTPPPEFLQEMGIEAAWLSRYPRELSGGEIQRFAIARALSPQTRVLIADEISVMLDTITQAQIWEALLGIIEKRRLALIVITHSPQLAERVATRITHFGDLTG